MSIYLICLFFSRWRNSSESSSQKPCSGHHSVWPRWLLAGCKRDGEFRRQRYVYRNTQDFGPQSKHCFFLQSTIWLMKWICTRCIQAAFFWFFLKYLIEHSWSLTSLMWLNLFLIWCLTNLKMNVLLPAFMFGFHPLIVQTCSTKTWV